MAYKKVAFIPFPSDAGQVIANLEAAYDQWHQARQTVSSLPSSMFWQTKGGTDYLAVKNGSYDSATTMGARSAETGALFASFVTQKDSAKKRVAEAEALIEQRALQYRALRLPVMLDKQGEVLLDACRYFMADVYPMDIDFVLTLPIELRDLFHDPKVGWIQKSSGVVRQALATSCRGR